MPRIKISSLASAAIVLAAGLIAQAAAGRPSSFDRYGIGGYIQVVGIHHGFHIETVVPGSDAERDQLKPHDIIVKIDSDPIRSLDHLRAVLAEAYLNDAEVAITYTRGTSLTHHIVKSQIKLERSKAVAKKRRTVEEVEDR